MHLDLKSIRKGCLRTKFYVLNFILYAVPDWIYRFFFLAGIRGLSERDKAEARERAFYYVRLPERASVEASSSVGTDNFKYPFGQEHKFSAYFFDLYPYVRLFRKGCRFHYVFGDIDYETHVPSFVKARPITAGTTNSVLFKLNSVRHFTFVRDRKSFRDKMDKAVFRNVVNRQPQRTRLIDRYIGHPMCNVGRINDNVDDGHPEYVKPYMPIPRMLDYKFILCIEGHDVATNLKWVMASNSLAVMPRPKIESWFMEGTLVGGVHYVEVKDDYSDLIEKMEHYIHHPEEAERIISNAHAHVRKFRNKKMERYTRYLVTKQYFDSVKAN